MKLSPSFQKRNHRQRFLLRRRGVPTRRRYLSKRNHLKMYMSLRSKGILEAHTRNQICQARQTSLAVRGPFLSPKGSKVTKGDRIKRSRCGLPLIRTTRKPGEQVVRCSRCKQVDIHVSCFENCRMCKDLDWI